MTIGENIRKIRKTKGLTQRELADNATLSMRSIVNYESEKRIPPMERLLAIAKALNVKVTELDPDIKLSPFNVLPNVTPEDYERWDNDKELNKAITLGNIPTDQLIEELNNRNDFPMKLKLK